MAWVALASRSTTYVTNSRLMRPCSLPRPTITLTTTTITVICCVMTTSFLM